MISDHVTIEIVPQAFEQLAPREGFGIPTLLGLHVRHRYGVTVIRYPKGLYWLFSAPEGEGWKVYRARVNRTRKMLRWAKQRAARRAR